MVFGKVVRVDPVDTDRYGRTVAWITVDGHSLNHSIVAAGMAWWYRKYAPGKTDLEGLELEARHKMIGLWADPNSVPPWEWRSLHRNRDSR